MKFESLLQILFLMDVIAVADTSLPQAVQIFGTVKVTSELKSPSFNANSAVYATIRQDLGTWTSAVRNIKAPPILSKRIPLSALETESRTPLTVSVRLDEDGVASTRSANDLVGQGTVNLAKDGSWSKFDIELV
eukprot:gene37846-45536_t